ncbi:putative membrane protein [Nakamurella sp. UYEF19]|uniref:glycosyltransferase family 87 protein n=1 Tax=Nakamurella sp. UYEF19 TaxID=1756392 RepID=UPI00339633CE
MDELGKQPAGDDATGAAIPGVGSGTGSGAPPEGVFGADEIARVETASGLSRSATLSPTERVIPTWTDPTVRRASEVIGGPLGRHAIVGRAVWLTPLRVCLLMAILILIFGWLFKAACIQQGPNGDGGGVTLDQSGQRPWITGCYNDVVPLYGSHKLDTQAMPYKTSWVDTDGTTHYMEYPVVTGYFMWGVSELAKYYVKFAGPAGLPVPLDVAAYFTIGAIILGMFYLWAVASTARIARRRVWDVAIMCLSPLLIVHAFTNWDLLAIGMTAGAMAAWARGRPVLAGALIGLGTAAKLYPVLLLGPLLLLCLRTGKLQGFVRSTIAAAVVWLAINLPIMALFPTGWYEFIKLNSERPAEYDSWYSIYTTLSGSTVFDNARGADSPTLLNVLSLLLFALACLAIGWFALSATRRPRLAQLIFLVVAAFLLTNKVWSPQYSLWLLPLVTLALPRWRPVLAWQFSEAVVWILLMLSFAGVENKGLSIYPFIGAAILRDILLVMLVVRVIREIQHPANDLIRMAGDDDPSGGVLENSPDRFVLPSIGALWNDLKRPAPERETVLVGAPDDGSSSSVIQSDSAVRPGSALRQTDDELQP